MSVKEHIKKLFLGATEFPSRLTDRIIYSRTNRAAAQFLKRFPQPELTAADKKEIDDYWRHYGIKFQDHKWFQMYYGVTGIHDPSFIPDPIARFALFRHYNDSSSIPGWDDKNLYETFIPDIKFPATLAHIYNHAIYDKNWQYHPIDQLDTLSEDIFNQLGEDKEFVIKVTKGSYAGQGVRLFSAKQPRDIKKILTDNIGGNFSVQERIDQSDFMSQFCSTSVNIFRVITWRHKGEIKVLSTSIRFGTEGHFTDVCFIDGEEIVNVVGVQKDGTVKSKYGSFRGLSDITVNLTEGRAPNFAAVLKMAQDGHKRLYPFDIVGWDITLDRDNNPVCIEYNVRTPGTILYQYANGPFGGEHTAELMEFLLDKNNLNKYIPKKNRID